MLPGAAPKPAEGRPRVPDRQALCGILFVLHTGINGITCRRSWASARA
ncbi:hypothetical protein ACFYW8_35950 [Streptomyces sp. NPDC002742]